VPTEAVTYGTNAAGSGLRAYAKNVTQITVLGTDFTNDRGMENAVLSPVQKADFWRVRIAWPNGAVHFVGRFASEKEADKWIASHAWWAKYKIPARRSWE
jgi:hypothetical protein